MGLFKTADQKHYRRWVNLVPALFFPGASHYLAGRKKAGILLFSANLLSLLGVLLYLLHPETDTCLSSDQPLLRIPLFITLAALVDSFRTPIPCFGVKKWSLLILLYLALVLGLPLSIFHLLARPYQIPTDAMAPTIRGIQRLPDGRESPGDHLFVNIQAYTFQEPKRGDLIALKTDGLPYHNPEKPAHYLKRIVALPGETVSIHPPNLLVNGKAVTEPAFFQAMSNKENGYSGYVLLDGGHYLTAPTDRCTLAEDAYFVLGDNSPNSLDSRFFGPIKRSNIIGKASYVYAPAERKGWIK